MTTAPNSQTDEAARDAVARICAAVVDEARALIAGGEEPPGESLAARLRADAEAEGRRRGLARAAIDQIEARALQQLERVLSVHRARAALARPTSPPPAPARPARRAPRAGRPTISGNMEVRRHVVEGRPALAWDPAAGVTGWEVRLSERPDARSEYVVRETATLPAGATVFELPLGDVPLRVHVLGRARDGRLVRRAIISALTPETWNERWQRRASAS